MSTLAPIRAVQPQLDEAEAQAVLAVLASGQLAQGPVVEAFEQAFARWCGVRHAVAVSSGTAALHLALLAHGIGPGDEVITTPFTFIASANAALFVGARPVFVDAEPETFNLDPTLVEAAITPRTRAILPVHLYGHAAQVPELSALAERHGLTLIEDACQAHGATVNGRKVGALGNTAAFSLYATKNLTSAEGGFVTTDDPAIAHQVELLRAHGAAERYRHTQLGYNFRLSDLHAAVGLAQLGKLDDANAARQRNATRLSTLLAGTDGVILPMVRPGYQHVWHQYTVRILHGRRDAVRHYLTENGIGTGIHYPIPVHQQPFYLDLGYGEVRLPVAERLAGEVLSLPIHPGLSDADLKRVADTLRDALASTRV